MFVNVDNEIVNYTMVTNFTMAGFSACVEQFCDRLMNKVNGMTVCHR